MLKESLIVKFLLWIFFSILFLSCLDPYNPPETASGTQLLVVDGRMINGPDSTVFRLFRTRSLTNDTNMMVESGAIVKVESELNNSFNLPEQQPGVYLGFLNELDPGLKYRLYIKTKPGKEYYSEWVEFKVTPELDSVSWEKKSDGVQIYTSTHDPLGKSRYYQYEFEETWKFRSFANSGLKYENGVIMERPREEQIYECFNYENSTIISLATSENLTEDIIHKNPLIFVPAWGTNKLSVRYTILVRQFAISKEAFQYWQKLKKVTEDIGTLFDPQPYTFKGNIYSVSDENEMVLGFVSASSYSEKRIFIDRKEYGYNSKVFTGYEDCFLVAVPGEPCCPRRFNPGDIPVYEGYDNNGNMQLFTGSPNCIDCSRKGTLTPPPYWQQ